MYISAQRQAGIYHSSTMPVKNSVFVLLALIVGLCGRTSGFGRVEDVCSIDGCRQASLPALFRSIGSPSQLNGMKKLYDLQAGAAALEAVRLMKEMVEEATKEAKEEEEATVEAKQEEEVTKETKEEEEIEENAKIEAERVKRKLEAIKAEVKNEEKHVKRQLKNPPMELLQKEGFGYDLKSPAERLDERLSEMEAEEIGATDEGDDDKEELDEDGSENAVHEKKDYEPAKLLKSPLKSERLVLQRSVSDENTSAEEDVGEEEEKKAKLTEADGGEELCVKKGVLMRLLRPVYRIGLFRTWE